MGGGRSRTRHHARERSKVPRRHLTASLPLLGGKTKGGVIQRRREYLGDYLPLLLGQTNLFYPQAGIDGHLRQPGGSIPLFVPHRDQHMRYSIPYMVGTMDLLKLGDQAPKGSRSSGGPPELIEENLKRVNVADFYPLPG